ncbi:MAG: ATP-dependent protease subunit HslV [Candidatus Marinimicrobia bacterium]|nr:ATP-dependent protease subunit HslV [Candidatus Neomarinimicrobiota bacterium]MCD6099077.1 ATP-dependent protease subunit HslV [Candidatus Neomarinimicrobiota bacterium]
MMKFYSTTIIGVRRDEKVALGSDGQVTFGDTIMKHSSSKVRKIYGDRVLVGFAGASADAFALFEKFEGKLDEFKGNIQRAAVELAKLWRTDKYLRRLEALLTVMDKEKMLVISGTGDVIEPDDNVIAIGSGGPYAAASARALLRHTSLTAREIVEESLRIAAEICVYTNNKFTILEL